MNKLALLLIPLVLVSSAAARADVLDDLSAEQKQPVERKLSAVSFGARVGLGIPSGKLDSGTTVGQIFGPAMVQDLMVDVRLGGRLILAPYAGYMMGTAGSLMSCKSTSESRCSIGGLQVGVMARYTWLRTTAVDAWVGYAFSRQWLTALGSGFAAEFAGNDHHASVGVDLFVNRTKDTRMGAFVDLALGRYDTGKVTGGYQTLEVTEHGFHQWTTIGAQFVF